MNILITGATGFVGTELRHLLSHASHSLLLTGRDKVIPDANCILTGDIATFDDWDIHLSGIDVVIHLAARVHKVGENDKKSCQRTNEEATIRLAKSAIRCGVKRFIFISTIKVNGENTNNGKSFTAMDIPAPKDAYADSKFKAEESLKKLLADEKVELVIIRPPLVYGPGVKANFLRLVNLANGGLFLPFSGSMNRRDMVSVANLCDLIAICIDHPCAAGKTFLVSDGKAYSTADIVCTVRLVSGLPSRLFYCPPFFIIWLLILLGKKELSDRLFGSLEVDITDTKEILGWIPRNTLEQTLRQMLS